MSSDLDLAKEVSKRVFELFPTPIPQENLDPILKSLMEEKLVIIDKSSENRVGVQIAPTGLAYRFPTLDRQ